MTLPEPHMNSLILQLPEDDISFERPFLLHKHLNTIRLLGVSSNVFALFFFALLVFSGSRAGDSSL